MYTRIQLVSVSLGGTNTECRI